MAKEWILNSATNRFRNSLVFLKLLSPLRLTPQFIVVLKNLLLTSQNRFNGLQNPEPYLYPLFSEILTSYDNYIGLQIKLASGVSHISQIFKERQIQEATHKKFTEKYGGKVFYVISIKEGNKKKIYNTEVIDEIKQEIKRLEKL